MEFDSQIDENTVGAKKLTLWDTAVQSCGYGMMIMCLLDFVSLYIGVLWLLVRFEDECADANVSLYAHFRNVIFLANEFYSMRKDL